MTFSTRQPIRTAATRGVLLLVAVLGSGCVTTFYQPLVSLQQPVVVDPQMPNFEGMRMLVRCVPGEYLGASDAQRLCRYVGMLFRNQGAEVDVEIPRNGRSTMEKEEGKKHQLVVDLSARLLHKDDSALLAVISGLTLTLVPTFSEFTFAQDITIRDAQGFLLAQDSVQGRFIDYFGVGVWGVNWVLDLLVRPPEDELSGLAAQRDFSRDYYRHLSQMVFNANVRSVVLKGFEN